jgi:hypothetical protein
MFKREMMNGAGVDLTVGIAVLVLAEGECLGAATSLPSVSIFADEIFVIDPFLKYITGVPARSAAEEREHFGNEAKLLDWAVKNLPIKSEWVMLLRCEEEVEMALQSEIKTLLASLSADVAGICLNRKTIHQDELVRWGGESPSWVLRIWRREKRVHFDEWHQGVRLAEGRTIRFQANLGISRHFGVESLERSCRRRAQWNALRSLSAQISRELGATGHPFTCRTGSGIRTRIREAFRQLPWPLSASFSLIYRSVFLLGLLDGHTGILYSLANSMWYFFYKEFLREFKRTTDHATSSDERWQVLLALAERISHPQSFVYQEKA